MIVHFQADRRQRLHDSHGIVIIIIIFILSLPLQDAKSCQSHSFVLLVLQLQLPTINNFEERLVHASCTIIRITTIAYNLNLTPTCALHTRPTFSIIPGEHPA